ncbi:transglutaminase-like cysteine peptidase [Bradyrhizobium retamae]|nr:transglutaminase-like cysteine peptidase [Bradyrhizobium retamae]
MTPRVKLRSPRSHALAMGLILALGVGATSEALAAEDTSLEEVGADLAPGGDQASPAKFFSINAVLAKHDLGGGRSTTDSVRLAALTPSNTATDAPPAVREAPAVGSEPFGLFTFRAPDGLLWRKWRGVEADMVREQAILDHCRADAGNCPAHAVQFLRLVNAVGAKLGRDKLDEANRGVNAAVRYVSDLSQHGEPDRWSTPLATFASTKGDCEDYAIAKYVALSAAGFPRNDLQIVLVRDRMVRQDHAVLAARVDGHWLLLDNRFSTLMADSEATRFTPLFAIDHQGVHLFATPYAKRPLVGSELQAAPAAAVSGKTIGAGAPADSASGLNTLPLLM